MDPSSPLRARLTVLGGFDMTFAGEPLRLTGPAQRLTAYLAVAHGRRKVRRTSLAERLWTDAPPSRAASNLRSVLWRLPRPRGRTLVVGDATTVRLHDDVEVDLWDAERIAEGICADPDRLAEAPDDALLHADLLPDWEEDWLEVERESFRQKRLHALERIAGALREQGRYTAALSAGLGAVRCEPLRESAHRCVIEVHLAEGNHAEALRQYDHYRRLLADELGLSPSPVIRRLVGPMLGRPLDSTG